jgi:hypothetical protein
LNWKWIAYKSARKAHYTTSGGMGIVDVKDVDVMITLMESTISNKNYVLVERT